MPLPCTVCVHPYRASVDRALVRGRVNVSALARSLGVGRKALERHRARHVARSLGVVDGRAQAEGASPVLVELARRYGEILQRLAVAERATLLYADGRADGSGLLSHVAIAGLLDGLRDQVGSLAEFVVDACDAGRLAEDVDPELDARIAAALERVVERANSRPAGL